MASDPNPNNDQVVLIDPRLVIPRLELFPRFLNPNFRPLGPQFRFLVPVRFDRNDALLFRVEEERTKSLFQFMENVGLIPSPEEEMRRLAVIWHLKQIVLAWIRSVACRRLFPKKHVRECFATVLTYGSYGLGAYDAESDIDALCVGPCFATLAEDFFGVLCNMLQSTPDITEMYCIKEAKVPLMRFKFNGISIDLTYAQLKVLNIPDNVDVLDMHFFLKDIDGTSWRSLSGVRSNKDILRLVPNMENFQSLLRCLKLWAKRRGVYCNLVGFFGGIHLVVLAAYVCQRHADVSITTLISLFFETFSCWPWPTPVMLQNRLPLMRGEVPNMHNLMPIQLPCNPYEFCQSNITRSTFHRISVEFQRGRAITRGILGPDFDWVKLFTPFPYTFKYKRFLRIFLVASNLDELGGWVGWVKSRFRSLLYKVEEVQELCDPNPTEYVDLEVQEPNIVFNWGLKPDCCSIIDIEAIEKYFKAIVYTGYLGPLGRLDLSIVDSPLIPKFSQ